MLLFDRWPDRETAKIRAQVFRPFPTRGVEIRPIRDPTHPVCGEFGLFATNRFAIGKQVAPYTGLVQQCTESEKQENTR